MKIIRELKEIDAKTSMALGFFDGIHKGHRQVIQQAVAGAREELVPAVFTFEESPLQALADQAPPLLLTNSRKAEMLREMGVAYLYWIPFSMVKALPPQVFFQSVLRDLCHAENIVCGYNFHFGAGGRGDGTLLAQFCKENDCRLQVVPPVCDHTGAAISSSRIRAAIMDGKMEAAEEMLGVPFGFAFEVVHGRRLGALLGTPTINQPFPAGFVVPRYGAYASVTHIAGKPMYSVTNIGVKPTVGSDHVLAETWIPEYFGDLYGKKIFVELISFIRPERKFENLDALKAEIFRNRDISAKITKKRLV